MVAVGRRAKRGPDICLIGKFLVQVGVRIQPHGDQWSSAQPGAYGAYEIGLAAEDVLDRRRAVHDQTDAVQLTGCLETLENLFANLQIRALPDPATGRGTIG